jgi:hypothetical protein
MKRADEYIFKEPREVVADEDMTVRGRQVVIVGSELGVRM